MTQPPYPAVEKPRFSACPLKPSSRPCLIIHLTGKVETIKGGPECQRTGQWCEPAAAKAPKDTRPFIKFPKPASSLPYDGLPPHDIDAEEAVLGSLLIAADWDELAPVYRLTPEDFYRERNGWVYAAIVARHKQGGVDQVTVAHVLEEQGRLQDVGGPAHLSYLITRCPTPSHAVHYAHIVKEMAERRQAIDQAGRMAAKAWEGKPVVPTLDPHHTEGL